MIDGGRIVGGIAILLVSAAVPIWVVSVHGATQTGVFAAGRGSRCIEPRARMRREHPQLLATWRQLAVRTGVRQYQTQDGLRVRISLVGSCLGCHGNATEFCDRCHATVAVSLDCWGCHATSARESSAQLAQVANGAVARTDH